MSFLNPNESDRRTAEAFAHPEVGDRFSEMLNFWVYVVARPPGRVVTLEANPPCTFPDDAKLWEGSLRAFRKRFAYQSIPGYWVHLEDRGNKVEGWLEVARQKAEEQG
jgi:hypothetical protein